VYLRVVRVCLQYVFSYVYGVHEPVSFQVVEGKTETHCAILFITHLECFQVVVCRIYVAFLLFFDQAHVLLGFNHGFVVLQALYQLFLGQIVLIIRDKEVSE